MRHLSERCALVPLKAVPNYFTCRCACHAIFYQLTVRHILEWSRHIQPSDPTGPASDSKQLPKNHVGHTGNPLEKTVPVCCSDAGFCLESNSRSIRRANKLRKCECTTARPLTCIYIYIYIYTKSWFMEIRQRTIKSCLKCKLLQVATKPQRMNLVGEHISVMISANFGQLGYRTLGIRDMRVRNFPLHFRGVHFDHRMEPQPTTWPPAENIMHI